MRTYSDPSGSGIWQVPDGFTPSNSPFHPGNPFFGRTDVNATLATPYTGGYVNPNLFQVFDSRGSLAIDTNAYSTMVSDALNSNRDTYYGPLGPIQTEVLPPPQDISVAAPVDTSIGSPSQVSTIITLAPMNTGPVLAPMSTLLSGGVASPEGVLQAPPLDSVSPYSGDLNGYGITPTGVSVQSNTLDATLDVSPTVQTAGPITSSLASSLSGFYRSPFVAFMGVAFIVIIGLSILHGSRT